MASIIRIGYIALLFGLTTPILAAERKLVDIDDYFTQAFVTSCELSPDGKQVVYSELRWEPPRESRNGDLWVVNVDGQPPRRLTFHKSSDHSPQWSSDSRFIYFLSSRKQGDGSEPPHNGKTQVWRISITGDRIVPITRLKSGVNAFELSSDGSSLYYTIGSKAKEDEWKALREKHSTLKYGRGTNNVSQLWKLDLQTWRAEKLVDEKRFIREFAVSPDGRTISMITAKDDLLISHEGWSRVDLFDSATKKVTVVPEDAWRKNVPSPYGWLEELAWCSDSQRFAFRVAFDGFPAEMIAAQRVVDGFKAWRLKRPKDVSIYGGPLHWHGQSLCFEGQWRARQRVYQIADVQSGKQGAVTTLTEGDVVIHSFSISGNGKQLSVIKNDKSSGRDVCLVKAGKPHVYNQLTETNPQMKNWKLPQISIVSWSGANGDRVEGILELPPDYVPSDKKLPMIVQIHGGPTAAELFSFRFWPYGRTLLASKGYAVLSPNYRGSTGYGDRFMTELVGRENDIEVTDILNGVDAMVKRGIADPDRLGVMGWSNGGFLTNAIISKTNRFKAASSGAGVIDQTIQWGLEDTPGHVINFMRGKQPWEDADEYRKGSPLYGLANATTPTLIHVGENDARVPAAHSRTLFRALNRYKNVPTQLIVYPNTGHSPLTYSFRKAKMAWDVAWFERYILGKKK